MAAQARQKNKSVSSNVTNANEQQTTEWIITDAASPDEANAALLAAVPATLTGVNGTLSIQAYAVEEQSFGSRLYSGTVTYSLADGGFKPTGESTFTFDTAGGTQHIQFSHGTANRYPGPPIGEQDDESAPDLGGAINVGTSEIGGVDIPVPAFGFSVTKYMAASSVTTDFLNAIYDLTGKANSADWTLVADGITLPFADCEVLYLGATGSRRGIGDVELTHRFSGSASADNITIGDISGISKKGWQYLWVVMESKVLGTGANAGLFAQPKYVYVENVYLQGDFTPLKLTEAYEHIG